MSSTALRYSVRHVARCLGGTRAASNQFTQPYVTRSNVQSSAARNAASFIGGRWHSTTSGGNQQYEFEKMRELTQTPSKDRILIDVREPAEYEAGYIPGAINIPVKSQPDAIFLSPEEFEDRFGFGKPSQEKEVIFYCRSGVRSSAAAQLAQQQGYKNISEYRGSWIDWEKNGGTVAKP